MNHSRQYTPLDYLRLTALAWAMVWAGGHTAQAQDTGPAIEAPAQAEPATTLTREQVQEQLDAMLADPQLDEATREAARGYYQTALQRLDVAIGSAETERSYRQTLADSEATLERLRGEAWDAAAHALSRLVPARSVPTPELEQAAAAAQGQASSLRSTLSELEAALAGMVGRASPLREELATENQKLADLERERESAVTEEMPTAVRRARELSLEARRLARVARIAALQQELATLPIRREITEARIYVAQVRLACVDQAVAKISERVSARRMEEAARQLAESERQARQMAGRHPVLAAYAEQTADLSKQLSETIALTDRAIADQAQSQNRWREFEQTRASLEQVLEIGAVGEDFAELLRELQSRLPATASVRQAVNDRQKLIINTRLHRLQVAERRRQLADASAAVEAVIAEARKRDESIELTATEREVLLGLVGSRAETLARLEEAYIAFITQLSGLNELDADLVEEADALSAVLDERLLWLPSAAPLGNAWLKRVGLGIEWLTGVSAWDGVGRHLGRQASTQPVSTTLVLLVVGVLFGFKRKMSRKLSQIAETVGSPLHDRYLLTPAAAGLCLLMALPVSLLLFWLGWLLFSANGGLFVYGLGGGLMNAGIVLYILRYFQVLSRRNALFHAHFRWSDKARLSLSRNLRWLIPVLLPIAILVPMTELSDDIVYRNGMGRLGFLVASVALSWFLYRVLHPSRGATADLVTHHGLVWRSRLVWFPVLSAAPFLLGLLAAVGYYVTALKLQGQLFTTAWVGLMAMILYGLAMRWVVVAHRRLAIRRAREQREKLLAEQSAKSEAVQSGEAIPLSLDASALDLSAISAQTRTMVRALVGSTFVFMLYLIWRDLVPALGALDQVALWSRTESTPNGDVVRSITVLGLLLAAFITALTVLAARNLPALIEMSALQRMSIDAGTRYAVTAISRYIILAIGLFIAFDRIGVGWGQMQFVVAALGVGLGFGLQEIVANFVSGIILLFERPIRVGDAVTVSELSGTVARIQIRATTIVDWDNREILVPNKNFITDRVINWTLTDPITRLVFPVGVAYGSDTAKVHKILMDVVKANPLVLEKPAATVFFVGFGESSLDFDVRVFVKDYQYRMPVKHELHLAIEKALHEAGIEIPFPQRDLHIRSQPPPPAQPAKAETPSGHSGQGTD